MKGFLESETEKSCKNNKSVKVFRNFKLKKLQKLNINVKFLRNLKPIKVAETKHKRGICTEFETDKSCGN